MQPAIEAKAQTTENIVRSLAERTILCPTCQGTGERELIGQGATKNPSPYTTIGSCPRTIPDSRFEALRSLRDIDASAGALLRAIQACGLAISLSFVKASPGHRFLRDTWLAVWPASNDDTKTDHIYVGTPEEALARALMMTTGDEGDA